MSCTWPTTCWQWPKRSNSMGRHQAGETAALEGLRHHQPRQLPLAGLLRWGAGHGGSSRRRRQLVRPGASRSACKRKPAARLTTPPGYVSSDRLGSIIGMQWWPLGLCIIDLCFVRPCCFLGLGEGILSIVEVFGHLRKGGAVVCKQADFHGSCLFTFNTGVLPRMAYKGRAQCRRRLEGHRARVGICTSIEYWQSLRSHTQLPACRNCAMPSALPRWQRWAAGWPLVLQPPSQARPLR